MVRQGGRGRVGRWRRGRRGGGNSRSRVPAGETFVARWMRGGRRPRTCGSSCTPCAVPPDGTATCDGMSCGGSCPTGKKLCQGACIDAAAACAGGCPAGQHACGGLCPSATDVKACGTSCLPCPVPMGATQATCDGTACGFQCTTGYHMCGNRCARDDDASACGMACTACPADPNGTAQCVGGTWAACGRGITSAEGLRQHRSRSCGRRQCVAFCRHGLYGHLRRTACPPRARRR